MVVMDIQIILTVVMDILMVDWEVVLMVAVPVLIMKMVLPIVGKTVVLVVVVALMQVQAVPVVTPVVEVEGGLTLEMAAAAVPIILAPTRIMRAV
jgi:hypothetical protein